MCTRAIQSIVQCVCIYLPIKYVHLIHLTNVEKFIKTTRRKKKKRKAHASRNSSRNYAVLHAECKRPSTKPTKNGRAYNNHHCATAKFISSIPHVCVFGHSYINKYTHNAHIYSRLQVFGFVFVISTHMRVCVCVFVNEGHREKATKETEPYD